MTKYKKQTKTVIVTVSTPFTYKGKFYEVGSKFKEDKKVIDALKQYLKQ